MRPASAWDILPAEMVQPCEACTAHLGLPMMRAYRAELGQVDLWTAHFVEKHPDYSEAEMQAFLRDSVDSYEVDEDGFVIPEGGHLWPF